MLSRLTVTNLAIVEKAEVCFGPGLNVLTGETGAGKSVLMGALDLVLGARADSSVVRDGAKEARVEAEFTVDGAAARSVRGILDDAGLPGEEDGLLVIRRTVGAGGTGRVWVNDCAAAVATLKKLGRALVDIHGPRSNQRLLEEAFQRETLDACGGVDLKDYAKAWSGLVDVRAEIARLEGEGASEDELDLLRYQVGELEEAGLSPDDDEIAAKHAAAAHAEEIVESANEITEALGGDEGAAELLSRLQPKFAAIARHMPEAAEWAAEAEDLTLKIQELSRSVADAASRIDADPEALAELDARLATVNRLKRKYLKGAGDSGVAELLQVLEDKRGRLARIEGREERLAELRRAESAAEAKVRLPARGARPRRDWPRR